MKPDQCVKCEMHKKDPLFWNTHQTMSDGHVWCTNAKRA